MNKQICILTGSTLGGAEYVAEHIQFLLDKKGISTNLLHGPSLNDVIKHKNWLIVSSTHGSGELPDNLKPLFEEITQKNLDLSQIRFAVIGLGSSEYDTFCYAVNQVEDTLLSKKAIKITESLKIDVINVDDPDHFAENWLKNVNLNLFN
ncbi:FMN-binding protein MioC [Histophilus somni]|uniref:FMN-binding protein MioC n=1 Tax=Histophilus somni TaxID=731 RepID=UPI00109C99B2|nr:FMN-binding protein MioC [Histophilus somni]QEH22476.1 FMN-binding protein MioC [Histophilus somni]THA50248.1 FMN-binding protein MioC [Histophilus somni]